jgi:Fe-S-cluster containining protein
VFTALVPNQPLMAAEATAEATMDDAYTQLLAKVAAFCASVSERRSADLACRAGCSACCEVWLTLSAVEAAAVRCGLAELEPGARERVRRRGHAQRQRELAGAGEPRCALLEDDGTCAIYEHRPLVCRTQGHALRYPAGFIPRAAVRARALRKSQLTAGEVDGEVTCCSLNYLGAAPTCDDVLDAERVDVILAVVNARFSAARQLDPEQRFSISELACGGDGLNPDDA